MVERDVMHVLQYNYFEIISCLFHKLSIIYTMDLTN
jgi:hypothetical protein